MGVLVRAAAALLLPPAPGLVTGAMASIDHATRTEELARDLAANFDRLTLGRFIAGELMQGARAGALGNTALKRERRAGFDRVVRFEKMRSAEDAALRAELERARKRDKAERKIKLAMKEARNADV